MPIIPSDQSAISALNLFQVLTNGNFTGNLAIRSNDNTSSIEIFSSNVTNIYGENGTSFSGTSFSGSGPDDLVVDLPFTGTPPMSYLVRIDSTDTLFTGWNSLVGSPTAGMTFTQTTGPGTGTTGTFLGFDFFSEMMITNIIPVGTGFGNAGETVTFPGGSFTLNSGEGTFDTYSCTALGLSFQPCQGVATPLGPYINIHFGSQIGHGIGDQWFFQFAAATGRFLSSDGSLQVIGDVDNITPYQLKYQVDSNVGTMKLSGIGFDYIGIDVPSNTFDFKDLAGTPALSIVTRTAYDLFGNPVMEFQNGTLRLNSSYYMPYSDGTVGQAMITDGAGNVTFQNTGSGSSFLNFTEIAVGDTSNIQTSYSTFVYDNANLQFRVNDGTVTPADGPLGVGSTPFLVAQTIDSYSAGQVYNRSATASASADWIAANDADDNTILGGHFIDLGINSSVYDETVNGLYTGGPNSGYIIVNGGPFNIVTQKTFPIQFRTGGYSNATFLRGFISATAPTLNFGTRGTATGIYQIQAKTSGTISLTSDDATNTYTITLPKVAPTNGQVLAAAATGVTTWTTPTAGTVTAVSVVSANGFAGSSSGGATPALTLSTTITGILKGNGTAISAASAGTDYQAPITLTTTGTSGAATFVANTLNIPNYATGGVTSVSNSDGTLTISPTTGVVVASLALGHANTWTGQQTFNTSTAIFGVAPTFSTMTAKSVLFAGTAGLLTQDNTNFQYDSTLRQLSIDATGTTNSLHTGPAGLTTNLNVGGSGVEFIGTNNTAGGHNVLVNNKSNGTSAFTDLFLVNDLGNSAGAHYGVINLNSSTYTDTSFGTALAVANQMSIYGTDGPTMVGAFGASQFVNFIVGGSAATNESIRITTTGITVGLGGTLTGIISMKGATSGTISIQGQAAAGTYNWNMPITAGTAGQVLTSQGGGATAMTWTTAGTGTVTSVGFTGGLISVATASTTPAFTVAGTSGGIPYFSSTSTWASSTLLAANAIMIGGGSGAAPATTTTGTGVLTALGLNVNGSGAISLTTSPAFVTPSLGVATATSINGTTITTSTGTLTMSTFTLTAVATGNLIVGNPGGSNRVMVATSSTAANGNASLTFDSSTGVFLSSVTTNTATTLTNQNSSSNTASEAQVVAQSSISKIMLRSFSGAFTTVGLNIADINRVETNSSVGMQFLSTTASTSFTWGIGGTASTNSIMVLGSTGLLTVGLAGTTTGTLALAGATSGATTITPAAAASGTLTLPAATGTLVIGSGANTRIGLWTSANNISSSASLIATATAVTFNTSNATSTSFIASNANVGVAAFAFLRASNNATNIDVKTYGTSFTTAGLLVAGLTSIESNSTSGMFHNVGSGGQYWWAINSTTTATLSLSTAALISNVPIRLKGYTVATLPAGTQGDTAFVTDALAPSFLTIIVGGGTVVTPVFYNGTNWVGH